MQQPPHEDAQNALARDDELLAPYDDALAQAVEQALAGGDPQRLLQELLAKVPVHIKAALTRRFNYALDERKPKRATAAPSAPPPPVIQETAAAPAEPEKKRFGIAQAALLMAAGTFDRIRALLGKRPDLQARIAEIGARLANHGVTADMMLLERLETIRTQAVQRAQAQAEQREQQMQRRK